MVEKPEVVFLMTYCKDTSSIPVGRTDLPESFNGFYFGNLVKFRDELSNLQVRLNKLNMPSGVGVADVPAMAEHSLRKAVGYDISLL